MNCYRQKGKLLGNTGGAAWGSGTAWRDGRGGRREGGDVRAAEASTAGQSNRPAIKNKQISKKRSRAYADVIKVGTDLKSSWISGGPTLSDGVVIRDRRIPTETPRKQSPE